MAYRLRGVHRLLDLEYLGLPEVGLLFHVVNGALDPSSFAREIMLHKNCLIWPSAI